MTGAAITNGVILAENDPLMRGIIRSVLLRTQHLVFPARDGMEAVLLARQFPARLVLLDIAMPRLNGLLACEAIRALPGYAAVPIVMLTGNHDARVRAAAERLGATGFLTKPFRPQVLLAHVAGLLGLPDAGTPEGDGDPLLQGRAQVWKVRQDPRPAFGEHPGLSAGREMMRIYREAEREE